MIIPQTQPPQMRRRTPHMQKHPHNHAQRAARQKHDRHLPSHDLQQTRAMASIPILVSEFSMLRKQVTDVFEPVAMRGKAVQAHSLVGCTEDAEEGEDDAAVPGCADGPGRGDTIGENVGPAAGRGEDAGEEGRLGWLY